MKNLIDKRVEWSKKYNSEECRCILGLDDSIEFYFEPDHPYDYPNSEMEYYFFYVPDRLREFFMKLVYRAGCYPVKEDDTDIYNNSKIKVVHLGSDIDLLTVSDKEYFDQEKNNHHMIERMVSGFSRPYGKTLIDYILDLKGKGVKGSTIYQMLVVAARER